MEMETMTQRKERPGALRPVSLPRLRHALYGGQADSKALGGVVSSPCHFSVSCHTVAVLMCRWFSLPGLSTGSKPHGRPETSVCGLWFSFVLIT